MEFIVEQFNIDMRKVNLYSKNIYMEYEFSIEETLLENPDNIEIVISEAGGNFIEKIKVAFRKIIEAIKRFFSNLIEKVKTFFDNKKEDRLKKLVNSNPDLAKRKILAPNIKEIEKVCNNRFLLRKKMIAEYKAGKLTRRRFNELIEQHEKFGKRAKTVGIITVTIGAVIAIGFGLTKLIPSLKQTESNTIDDSISIEKYAKSLEGHKVVVNMGNDSKTWARSVIDEVYNKVNSEPDEETVSGIEVAQNVATGVTEDERIKLQARLETLRKAVNECDKEYQELRYTKYDELLEREYDLTNSEDRDEFIRVTQAIEDNKRKQKEKWDEGMRYNDEIQDIKNKLNIK